MTRVPGSRGLRTLRLYYLLLQRARTPFALRRRHRRGVLGLDLIGNVGAPFVAPGRGRRREALIGECELVRGEPPPRHVRRDLVEHAQHVLTALRGHGEPAVQLVRGDEGVVRVLVHDAQVLEVDLVPYQVPLR